MCNLIFAYVLVSRDFEECFLNIFEHFILILRGNENEPKPENYTI